MVSMASVELMQGLLEASCPPFLIPSLSLSFFLPFPQYIYGIALKSKEFLLWTMGQLHNYSIIMHIDPI